MNLYEINNEIENLLDSCVNTETGEIEEDYEQKLEAYQLQLDEKIENIAMYIKNKTAYINAMIYEIETLKTRIDIEKNKQERNKKYLSNFLLHNNMNKFTTARVDIGFRKSEAVELDDEFYNHDFMVEKICVD